MTKKPYQLTPEHEAKLKPWADKWVANALSTKPIDDGDRTAMLRAVSGLYATANLPQPVNVVFAKGPVTGSIAAGIAAGIWHLRDHPELFGKLSWRQELEAIKLTTSAFFGGSKTPTAGVSATTEMAIHTATRVVAHDATDAATHVATRAATTDATRDATDAAAYVATDAATHAATYDATDDVVHKTGRSSEKLITFLVECAKRGQNLRHGGNQWSGWVAYLSFFRHVAKLDLDYSKLEHYERAAIHAGPRFMHKYFCIVADRPTVLRQDAERRPHCATGPSHVWADGVRLYYWHGVKIPGEWIEQRDAVDPRLALTWSNIEQRAALAQIIGWDKVLSVLHPTVIDRDDPEIGELLEVDLPGAPDSRFLRVRGPGNAGPDNEYVLGVPRECKTALEANYLFTYRLNESALKLKGVVRT